MSKMIRYKDLTRSTMNVHSSSVFSRNLKGKCTTWENLTARQELDLLVVLVEITIEFAIGVTAVILERVQVVVVLRRIRRVQGPLLPNDVVPGVPKKLVMELPGRGNQCDRAGSQDQQRQHPP